jgi:hypothetical protein
MTPQAEVVAKFLIAAAGLPEALEKLAAEKVARDSAVDELHELMAAWWFQKLSSLQVGGADTLGPPQDPQAVGMTRPAAAPPAAQESPKTLEELMGSPDVRRWFNRSVEGLGKRSKLPYALLAPGQEPQTNLERNQLQDLLKALLAKDAQ